MSLLPSLAAYAPIDPRPDRDAFSISDLSNEFEVTARALRFYEDEGLISPERRGTARIYSHRDRARLAWILRGKRVGFSLGEIRELLDLYDIGDGAARSDQPRLRVAATGSRCSKRKNMISMRQSPKSANSSPLSSHRSTTRRTDHAEIYAPRARHTLRARSCRRD